MHWPKIEKNVVKMFINDELYSIELAPRDLICKIAEENELKTGLRLEPDIVAPNSTVTVKGGFQAPSKEGKYRAYLSLEGPESTYRYEFENDLLVTKEGNNIIDRHQIKEIYRSCFRDTTVCEMNHNWGFADQKYKVANIKQVQEVVKKSKTYMLKYEAEAHDCDDYAYALMGYIHYDPSVPKWQDTVGQAIFITWVILEHQGQMYGHALLSCCDGNNVYMIEPQNGKVYNVPDKFKLYLING